MALRNLVLILGACAQLTAIANPPRPRAQSEPANGPKIHDEATRQRPESSSHPEASPSAHARIKYFVDHYDKLNTETQRGKVTPEALTGLIDRVVKSYGKLKQKDPAVRGESSTEPEGFNEFQLAGNNLLGALGQLGVNQQVNFQDPAQMQQLLAALCLEQLGGLNQNLAGLYGNGALGGAGGLGGLGGFGGAFREAGPASKPPPSGQKPGPELQEAPLPAPGGASLWWKSDPFTGIYFADFTSPVTSNDGSGGAGWTGSSPAAGNSPGGTTPNGPLQPPQIPNFPQGINCPNFPGQQGQKPPGQPEEGEEGDGGGGTPGGQQSPQAPSGGGGPPPGGGGGPPQGAQIGRQGPFAPFVVGQIPPDLAVPFGQISRAVGSLLPPDFQDWVNRSAAEMLAVASRQIFFPGYKAKGGPVQSFALNGNPVRGNGSNGGSLLGVRGILR